MRDTGIMNDLSISRTATIMRWNQLSAFTKRDPRNDPEVFGIAVDAAEAWQSEQISNGVLSFSVITYLCTTGMQRGCALAIADELNSRLRGPDQVAPIIAACDQVCVDARVSGDHAARVAALKLKAQLQGALAPKVSETKVTISIADELAKRTKAVRERKQAEAKVIVDQSRPMTLQDSMKLLVKDVNSDG